MNLADLLKKDIIRKVEPDRRKALELLSAAGHDIKAAEDNLAAGHCDWALAIAYNAMLSSGRAFMLSKGYAPVAEAHHLAVVQFCAAVLPADAGTLVVSFNRYRVRRHDIVYGEAGSVGKGEAENAISSGRLFIAKIREKGGF